jgi:hypothetical protein
LCRVAGAWQETCNQACFVGAACGGTFFLIALAAVGYAVLGRHTSSPEEDPLVEAAEIDSTPSRKPSSKARRLKGLRAVDSKADSTTQLDGVEVSIVLDAGGILESTQMHTQQHAPYECYLSLSL